MVSPINDSSVIQIYINVKVHNKISNTGLTKVFLKLRGHDPMFRTRSLTTIRNWEGRDNRGNRSYSGTRSVS